MVPKVYMKARIYPFYVHDSFRSFFHIFTFWKQQYKYKQGDPLFFKLIQSCTSIPGCTWQFR